MSTPKRKLSDKQLAVRDMILAGIPLDEMEERMGITYSGVSYHLTKVLQYYDVRSREDLVELEKTGRRIRKRPKPVVKLRKAAVLPTGVFP